MSAGRRDVTPIRYLSIDEMMLKVAEMRAARLAAAEPEPEPAPQTTDPQPHELRFPDYVSHWEAWSAVRTADGSESDSTAGARGPGKVVVLPPVTRLTRRPPPAPQSAIRAGAERYVFSILTAGIAALILIGTALNLGPGQPRMMNTAVSRPDLVAGSEAWDEIPNDDVAYAGPVATAAAPRARPRISPEKLENDVREVLASNGFPDVGVSASHHGEVYLAGKIYSIGEAHSIVRLARLAAHRGRVYFLHPELRSSQGAAFFGALAEYAPGVWGASIRRVIIGSPAYKAGIRAGDIIREFDGRSVNDARDLARAVAEHKPGQRVVVRIWRDGASIHRIARLCGLTQFAQR
jgi:hypothetical protein